MKQETRFSMARIYQQELYDQSCKEFFRNKEVIAPILQAVVSEYKGYSLKEIESFIDADSIKDEIPVSDLPPKIEGLPVEMSSTLEKTIYYDVHFIAYDPVHSTKRLDIRLHIDFEVQKTYKPSNPRYPIIKRGIYYAARELSSQLGTLTEETNYAALEKVYSIWICNQDVPPELQNTISRYSLCKEDLLGTTGEPEREYDLLEVIIVRRGPEAPEDNDLLQYLEGIFTSDIKRIDKYIDNTDNSELQKEVEKVTGLGEALVERGIKLGKEQGREEGLEQGREEGLEQGIDLLFEVVTKLREGTDPHTLLKEGYKQEVIDKALLLTKQ